MTLEDAPCSICGFKFKGTDKVVMVKTTFKFDSITKNLFFEQTPVSLSHIECTRELTPQQTTGRTINDVMEFFGQRHVYEYMTKTNFYKEDNKRIFKDLGIKAT